MKTQTLIAAFAATLMTSAAFAMPGGGGREPNPERVIEHLDQDGDSLVSYSEFKPPRGRAGGRFERADADGDGNVSRAEMEARLAEHLAQDTERAEELFDLADQNNDDFVSQDEIKRMMFDRVDANEDGYISVDELTAAREERQSNRPERPERSDT